MSGPMIEQDFIIENHLNGVPVDLVVGIPSFNEADSIGFVVEQVAKGLQEFYPHLNTAIINVDNFSEDGTKHAFLAAESGPVPKVYLSTPQGVKGKGNNFHNLFLYLSSYQPKVVVVVDADLRSIRPDWPHCLAEPIINGYDFVTPIYSRNEYDGTITNHLCYPLIYGLLGKNIRQPIGGEFAFSNRLMNHWRFLRWGKSARQYGVDIFLTAEALLGGFQIAQVVLGSKVHKPSAPKLGEMFIQVVDTLFTRLLESRGGWEKAAAGPETPPVHRCTRSLEPPQGLSIDYKGLKRQAGEEFEAHRGLIVEILPCKMAKQILEMFQAQRFRVSSSRWAKIVCHFLCAYDQAEDRSRKLEVIGALKPLYFARVVSFIRATLELDYVESEKRILHQAQVFRSHRSAIVKKLSSPLSAAHPSSDWVS
jgi:glucosylglycerate synthase